MTKFSPRADKGLVDADLGGNLIKQRIARKGKGKSGGYRMIIAYRVGTFALFIYGFAKKDRETLDAKELATARQLAEVWLSASPAAIEQASKEGKLIEVEHEQKDD